MEFRDLKAQYAALKPQMDEAIAAAVAGGAYILGPQVAELENRLAEYVGAKHCVSCGDGTDALALSLAAWETGPGDAVFLPDLTFFATAEAVAAAGATPVFVDIDPATFNLDAGALEGAVLRVEEETGLTPKAVIAVDLFGLPADFGAIKTVCDVHGLPLLEDGAQGFGGAIGGKRACGFGDIGTTSFFPAKPLGCYGDGGAIFTDDDGWAEVLRSLRFHGKGEDKYFNVRVGWNSRLDTLQAAVLLVKLAAFPDELEKVNAAARMYTERLAGLVEVPRVPEHFYSSWAQYSILLENEAARDGLKAHLQARGIPSMIYYPVLMHEMPALLGKGIATACPNAENARARILSLPIGPYIAEAGIDEVCAAVRGYLDK